MKIHNPTKEKLRMRIKLNYTIDNNLIVDDIELNTFSQQCYQ